MPLDPQIEAFLGAQAQDPPPPIQEQSPAMAREAYLALAKATGPGPDLHQVANQTIPGLDNHRIPIRIYRPSEDTALPILVFFHGGGWVIGDLDTHDEVCRKLAKDAGVMVVAVDYRLAPEHPYPAAVHDCYAALQWVSANAEELGGDALRLAVGGDSAGGNLAAVICQIARDREGPQIRMQLLIYPAVDMTQAHPSVDENGDGYVLTRHHLKWYRDHYIPDSSHWTDAMASPLLADDLSRLPAAFIITAEFDPLRDEGEDYARQLKRRGGDVEVQRYDGMVHIFYQLSVMVTAGQDAINRSVRALQRELR